MFAWITTVDLGNQQLLDPEPKIGDFARGLSPREGGNHPCERKQVRISQPVDDNQPNARARD